MTNSKIFALLSLFASFGTTAAHECTGKVLTVDLSASSTVHVSINGIGSGNIVCSLTANEGLFTPESCKAAFSMLTAAKLSGSNVRLWFKDDRNTSCNKGNWISLSSHSLYYLRIE